MQDHRDNHLAVYGVVSSVHYTTPVPQKFVAFAAITSAAAPRDASGRTATLFFFSECNITQFAPTKQTGSHWRWRPWLCPCSVFVCRRSRETVEQLGSCLFWMLWFWFSIDRERPDATTVIDSSCILCFIVGAIVYSVGQTRRNRQPICWLRKVICSLILAALKFRSVITTESACSLWL